MESGADALWFRFEVASLGIVAGLLLVAVIRWGRTPETHPDHAARRDMTRLLALVLAGELGAIARDRLVPLTPGYWLLSVVLLLVIVGVLAYIRRLLDAYRQSHSGPRAQPKQTLPTNPSEHL